MRHSADIDLELSFSVPDMDKTLRVLVRRVEESLRSYAPDPQGALEIIRDQLELLLRTHESSRILMRTLDKADSKLGDSLSLVREQVERVFLVALILDDPYRWAPVYQRDQWAKMYKLFSVEAEETADLPRFSDFNDNLMPAYLEAIRLELGISDDERDAIKFAVLSPGVTAPSHLVGKMPERFPTPAPGKKSKVKNSSLHPSLDRWYLEYERLCDFCHIHLTKVFIAKISADPRLSLEVKVRVSNLFAEHGLVLAYVSAACICAEIHSKYPLKLEALESLARFWQQMQDFSLLGRWMWSARVRELLPPLLSS